MNGAFLVDDSYNANPSSLKAGLDALRGFSGQRWLVLGDMLELGDSANELHAEVGRYARQAGIERLLAIGRHSHFAVEAFGRGAQWFNDIDALIVEARRSLKPDVAVLIKGSRANRLERVSSALMRRALESGERALIWATGHRLRATVRRRREPPCPAVNRQPSTVNRYPEGTLLAPLSRKLSE